MPIAGFIARRRYLNMSAVDNDFRRGGRRTGARKSRSGSLSRSRWASTPYGRDSDLFTLDAEVHQNFI